MSLISLKRSMSKHEHGASGPAHLRLRADGARVTVLGEHQPVRKARQGVVQGLVADGVLGPAAGRGSGEHVGHGDDEAHVFFGEAARACGSRTPRTPIGRVLAGYRRLDDAHRLRARPQLGDLETGLAGKVVTDHGLLGDKSEADRRGGRVGREQLGAGRLVSPAGRHGDKRGVGHGLEHVHEVDFQLFGEQADGVLDEVGVGEPDERPAPEVGERRLAGGIGAAGASRRSSVAATWS